MEQKINKGRKGRQKGETSRGKGTIKQKYMDIIM